MAKKVATYQFSSSLCLQILLRFKCHSTVNSPTSSCGLTFTSGSRKKNPWPHHFLTHPANMAHIGSLQLSLQRFQFMTDIWMSLVSKKESARFITNAFIWIFCWVSWRGDDYSFVDNDDKCRFWQWWRLWRWWWRWWWWRLLGALLLWEPERRVTPC